MTISKPQQGNRKDPIPLAERIRGAKSPILDGRMTLLIVGLGLDIGDISSKGLAALKTADEILIETYTLPIPEGYAEFIKKETGKEARMISRKDMEDEVKETVGHALNSTIAILVSGDPLVATTHHIAMETARVLGVEYTVYHAPSIFSAAIGESGLDLYKFGPTTTIPFWSAKYKPTSFLDVIKRNYDNNQHTLVLLDVDPRAGRTMSARDAIELLGKAEEKKRHNVINKKRRILVLCEVGTAAQDIMYIEADVSHMGRMLDRTEGKRTSLIIPAEMSFAEERLVSAFSL